MRFSHFTDATAYQWGTISRKGAPWSATQRLAVHLVGDQDLRRRIGRVGERQRANEGQVVLVGVREDRLEVVRAVVGAFEPDVDAVRGRARLLQHLVQEGAGPARGRDRVVAPWLTDRAAVSSRAGRSRRIRA